MEINTIDNSTASHSAKPSASTDPMKRTTLVTLAEVAAILTDAIGRPVEYIAMNRADYAQELTEAGIPDDVAAHITEVIVDALDGRNAWTTNDVELVLGRPARDFTEFARDAAVAGAWDLPA